MNAVYLDSDGKAKPYIMGCYGIGVTRTAAAAVEAHHDDFGIKWPLSIAPYHAVVVPVSVKDELQMKTAEKIYNDLLAQGVEVVIDDRDERPGVKFKDADLIGFPYRITVGKTISEGKVEFVTRATGEKKDVTSDEAVKTVVDAVNNIQ
jgi:prolyl-tRNA synthetase